MILTVKISSRSSKHRELAAGKFRLLLTPLPVCRLVSLTSYTGEANPPTGFIQHTKENSPGNRRMAQSRIKRKWP